MFWTNHTNSRGLSDLGLYRAHIRALQNKINHLTKRYYRAEGPEKHEIDEQLSKLINRLNAVRRAENQR